jgi:hypothetical protein
LLEWIWAAERLLVGGGGTGVVVTVDVVIVTVGANHGWDRANRGSTRFPSNETYLEAATSQLDKLQFISNFEF